MDKITRKALAKAGLTIANGQVSISATGELATVDESDDAAAMAIAHDMRRRADAILAALAAQHLRRQRRRKRS